MERIPTTTTEQGTRTYTIVERPSTTQADIQFVQHCLDVYQATGLPFPYNLKNGESKTLIDTDREKITLLRDNDGNFQFLYRHIVNGCGTTFPSALFTIEEN